MRKTLYLIPTNSLFAVLLSTVSATYGQLRSENSKWRCHQWWSRSKLASPSPTKHQNKYATLRLSLATVQNLHVMGRPGVVSLAFNTSTVGGQGGKIIWTQEFETSLGNMVKPCLLKIQKISQAWWQTPVIPTTQEAETQESLEPGRQRLQWAKIAPLHSTWATEQDSAFKKKKKKNLFAHSQKKKNVVNFGNLNLYRASINPS